MVWRYETYTISSRMMIVVLIGMSDASPAAPSGISTVIAASGPYAAELSASSPSIGIPTTGPTRCSPSSWEASGLPKSTSRMDIRSGRRLFRVGPACQSIAYPRLAEQVAGIARIGLDLLAKLRDQHPKVLRLIDGVGPPNGFQDGTMRQYTVGVSREQREQFELFRRQPNLVVATHDAVTAVVDGQVADLDALELGGLGFGDAPQRDADAGEQLFRAERLRHVVVRADVERRHLVRLAAARRQNDDRHLRMLADPAAYLDTFQIWQTEIQDDQVGRMVDGDGGARGFRAGAHDIHVVTARSQEGRDRPLNGHIVVNQQDPHRARHGTSAGTTIVKQAPPSGQFSAEIVPRSTARMPRAIASPMPVPERRRFALAPR